MLWGSLLPVIGGVDKRESGVCTARMGVGIQGKCEARGARKVELCRSALFVKEFGFFLRKCQKVISLFHATPSEGILAWLSDLKMSYLD